MAVEWKQESRELCVQEAQRTWQLDYYDDDWRKSQ